MIKWLGRTEWKKLEKIVKGGSFLGGRGRLLLQEDFCHRGLNQVQGVGRPRAQVWSESPSVSKVGSEQGRGADGLRVQGLEEGSREQ